jgi:ribosomal protein S18 acetylase RimI-like enzyme
MATGSNAAQINIRRATLDDLPQLRMLLERYYDEWHVVQRDPPERVAEYMASAQPCGFVIAERDDEVVGCVLLRELCELESALECKRLYVVSDHRGHGLASRLMDHVESMASRFADWIYLDTGGEFTAAQSLYRARGYELCERYNDNPQAVLFYRKRLRN